MCLEEKTEFAFICTQLPRSGISVSMVGLLAEMKGRASRIVL